MALTTLTEEEREANILPGLAHSSLISIGKFCDTDVKLASISTPWMSLKINK